MTTTPALIAYAETASWGSSANNRATGSLTWQTGDLLVAVAGDENGQSLGTVPTYAGGTFAAVAGAASGTSGGSCAGRRGRRSRRRRVPGR